MPCEFFPLRRGWQWQVRRSVVCPSLYMNLDLESSETTIHIVVREYVNFPWVKNEANIQVAFTITNIAL